MRVVKPVLVTGASGFVGRNLGRVLGSRYPLIGVARGREPLPGYSQILEIGDLSEVSSLRVQLGQCQAVVHLAALAHVDEKKEGTPDYHRINCAVTKTLAETALDCGVSRFIFLSTAIVHGSGSDFVVQEASPLRPESRYAESKVEAEKALETLVTKGLKPYILRPPRVYGPGVRENFLRLLRFVAMGLPLPFRGVGNRRSFVFVDNLVSAIEHGLNHPDLVGTFLVADQEALSIEELLEKMSKALGRKTPATFPFPQVGVQVLFRLLGRDNFYRRLTESMVLDTRRLQATGWIPPWLISEGLAQTAEWYRQNTKSMLG